MTQEIIVIEGEWNRDGSINYKATEYTQNPGEFMKKVGFVGKGLTERFTDADFKAKVQAATTFFSTQYPNKKIAFKVL